MEPGSRRDFCISSLNQEIVMAAQVAGELYGSITGQLFEIGRQLRQPNGYPFDPEGLKNFLQLAVEGKFNGATAPAVKPKLLVSVANFHALGATKFVAVEHFKVDTSRKAKVRIAFLWDNFANNFVPKVEDNVPAGELKVYKLLESSLDAPIIAELGERHETYLSDLWVLLEKQPSGENGFLLTNGYANIFYLRDASGNLWAVGARWFSGYGGWGLSAGSVLRPGRWHDGDQVVSR
jgi:hypothetical protein